ncbi:MAG: hypothetical protein J6J87_04385, partial [Oscillospiraceae bacterium]|nr:hypothetical protein [Oscillospiraceae bacterium]
MKGKQNRSALLLVLLLCVSMMSMFFANRIQTDNGSIRVTQGRMDSPAGELVYKLYVPKTATESTPAPGVLLLHGYQNDHETCAAYAIELARRGVVVLALDEYGHGATTPGLLERGYVDHKVTVNFGQESEADGT